MPRALKASLQVVLGGGPDLVTGLKTVSSMDTMLSDLGGLPGVYFSKSSDDPNLCSSGSLLRAKYMIKLISIPAMTRAPTTTPAVLPVESPLNPPVEALETIPGKPGAFGEPVMR